jgi:hypothetical protein
MTTSDRVTIPVADGGEMAAYVARPAGNGPFPAMLVFQEALGINRQIRGVADRYAALGFLTVAPELFHRTHPGFETQTFDRDVIMPLVNLLTIDGMVADVVAAHAWVSSQPDAQEKIAAVGYCGRTSRVSRKQRGSARRGHFVLRRWNRPHAFGSRHASPRPSSLLLGRPRPGHSAR